MDNPFTNISKDKESSQIQDKNKVGASNATIEKSSIKSDIVEISDTAKQIQEAKKQLDNISDVREDKVAQLKSEIENGTYEIDAEKIADKMIKEGLINDLMT